MNNTANWPIRVGGEYADKSSLTIYRRVTAIADDLVNYMVCSRGGASSDDFPGEQTASSFRRLHHPEDQSPLPALIEALENLLEAIPKQTDDADWWPDELTFAVRDARCLLVNVACDKKEVAA